MECNIIEIVDDEDGFEQIITVEKKQDEKKEETDAEK